MLSHRKIKASSNLVQKESEIIKNHIRMTSILAHTFFYLLSICFDGHSPRFSCEFSRIDRYRKISQGVSWGGILSKVYYYDYRENEFKEPTGTHHGYNFKM